VCFENFDFSSVELDPVHLFERLLEIFFVIEADLAPARADSLMRIGVGHFATLSERVFQVGPAAS